MKTILILAACITAIGLAGCANEDTTTTTSTSTTGYSTGYSK